VATARQGCDQSSYWTGNLAPPTLAGSRAWKVGRRSINSGKWQGNKPPRYNENKDKALVACEFIAGRDLLVHTATFHKVDGKWRLRSVRETMQALLARAPEADGEPDLRNFGRDKAVRTVA
jgi:hypothetical protein